MITLIPAGVAEESSTNDVGAQTKYVTFGSYPQYSVRLGDEEWNKLKSGKDENGDGTVNGTRYRYSNSLDEKNHEAWKYSPINWEIIDSAGGYYDLMCTKIIEIRQFSDWMAFWDQSDIRTWLNETFLDVAFSKEEQNDILEKENVTMHSEYTWPEHMITETPTTSTEKVALPETEFCEARSPAENIAYSTQYAYGKEVAYSYWTRNRAKWSLGTLYNYYINYNGELNRNGAPNSYGIRPVIRVKKTSKFLKAARENVSYRPSGGSRSLSEDELYKFYPKYLTNKTILDKTCKAYVDSALDVLASRGKFFRILGIELNTADAKAALKSEMLDGGLKFRAFYDTLINYAGDKTDYDYTSAEEKMDVEMALEAIQYMTEEPDGVLFQIKEVIEELAPAVKELKTYNKAGKIEEDNRLARKMYEYFSKINPDYTFDHALKVVKKAENKNVFDKAVKAFKAYGIAVDVYDMAVLYSAELCASEMVVNTLYESLSPESRLYSGVRQIRDAQKKDWGELKFIEAIADYGMDTLAKKVFEEGEDLLVAAFTDSSAVTLVADAIYMGIGSQIKSATIDDVAKAWLAVTFAMDAKLSFSRWFEAFTGSKGSDKVVYTGPDGTERILSRPEAQAQYHILFDTYVSCIELVNKYTNAVIEKDKKKSDEQQTAELAMKRARENYVQSDVSYYEYIDSCIKNVIREVTLSDIIKTTKGTLISNEAETALQTMSVSGAFSYDIPRQVEEYTTAKIGSKAFRDEVVCVTIPETVTELKDDAFNGCKNLVAVYGGENLKTIGNRAFANCCSLKYVELSRSVQEIAENAFTGSKDVTVVVEKESAAEEKLSAVKNIKLFKKDKEVKAIKIVKDPASKNSAMGIHDRVDLTGMELQVTYENGTQETVADMSKVGSFICQRRVGNNTVYVNYGGKETTFSVQIKDEPFKYKVEYRNEVGEEIAKATTGESTYGARNIELEAPEIKNYTVDRTTTIVKPDVREVYVVRYTDTRKDVNNLSIQYTKEVTYSKKYKPDVVVKDGDKTLTEGTDYVLEYELQPINGEQVIALLGKNGYKEAVPLTINVNGAPATEKFSDVADGKWFTDAIYYCRDKGYMAGRGNNKFDPNGTVTRATITQVLYAMEGKPSGIKSYGFKDVASGKWFTDSVNWAASVGIVAGYSKTKFGPDDPITRQQMAAIMYQYTKYKKYDASAKGDISKFKDVKNVTKYAIEPMKWAVGHNIISGTNIGLEPKGTATRAQIAVILRAFDNNVRR